MSANKLIPGTQARFQRGSERVELVLRETSSMDPSSLKQVMTVSWPTEARLEKREVRGSKAARSALNELREQLLAAGFAVTEEVWTRPAEPLPPALPRIGVPMPHSEAQALVESSLDDCDEVFVHEGSLEVEGDLAVQGALLVRGDLTVSGDLTDDEGGLLCVTGNVQCRSAALLGSVTCEGAFFAEEYVFLCSGNDYGFSAARVATKLLVEAGTATWADQLDATVWRTMNVVASLVGGEPREHPRIAPAAMGRDALVALGLDAAAVEELEELLAHYLGV